MIHPSMPAGGRPGEVSRPGALAHRCALDGQVLWLDGDAEALTGFPAHIFTGGAVRWRERIAAADRERVRATIDAAVQDSSHYDITYAFERADGSVCCIRDIGFGLRAGDGSPLGVAGTFFDATALQAPESALREALIAEHRRFEQVVEASGQVVYEEEMATRTTTYSSSLRTVFGYTHEEHGSAADDWDAKVHPEDLPMVRAAAAKALAAGRPVDLEYRYRHANGDYRWVWDRASFDFDALGRVVRVVGVMQDVTARKQLEAQVATAERMETVGALAAGVAHDVNNYLAAILGNVDIALMRLGDAAEWPELTDAREAALGCAGLVKGLLTFARRREAIRTPIDPCALVEESLRLLRRAAGTGVSVTSTCAGGCGAIEADRVQLQQVLVNLVVNASTAMGGEGAVRIALRQVRRAQHPGEDERAMVEFRVSDTGPGVPQAIRERIFEPYFTTRPVGEGTGLGLSIVHGVVTGHGGWIEVAGEEGAGAVFAFYLPQLEG